jgi:hypothetical protein
MLGERDRRRLVPTRWSITAVHDIIGEEIKKDLRDFDSIDRCMLFSYEHFGNHFEIILAPGNYSFELVEIWARQSFWDPAGWVGYDKEDIRKRRNYSILSGGYYAARLPVLEYMLRCRKKASVIIIREIKPEYFAPLGVWVVEEGVRKALKSKPDVFDSFEVALEKAAASIATPKNKWLHHLKSRQTSLTDFISAFG